MLRGAIFGRFSVYPEITRKLPRPGFEKRIYRPAQTQPGPGNFGLIHTLTDSN